MDAQQIGSLVQKIRDSYIPRLQQAYVASTILTVAAADYPSGMELLSTESSKIGNRLGEMYLALALLTTDYRLNDLAWEFLGERDPYQPIVIDGSLTIVKGDNLYFYKKQADVLHPKQWQYDAIFEAAMWESHRLKR